MPSLGNDPAWQWVLASVERRIQDAARCHMRMPMPRDGRPKGHRSNMPEPLFDFWELMNSLSPQEKKQWERDNNRVRVRPSAKAIANWERVMQWFYIFEPRDRNVLFARALGFSYRKISHVDGRSREQLRKLIAWQHETIALKLNRGEFDP